MTRALQEMLTELAEATPAMRMPQDLWQRGRRIRRRRRIAAVLAFLPVVVAALWLPSLHPATSRFAGDHVSTLPARVAQPYLWQQTFGADPNGPAKLTFWTKHALDLDGSLVVVGRDDTFRLIYLDPGAGPGGLSPDGRYLLGDHLVDLSTGRSRRLAPAISSNWPVVWAPDSRSAVAVVSHDDVMPTTGPNGERINDPTRLDNIVIVSVPDGGVRVLHVGEAGAFRAAFSPDGARLAVTVGHDASDQQLLILDVATGTVQRAVPLGRQQQIAGSAAWTPDGRQLLLTFTEDCPPSTPCDGSTPDQPAPQRFHLQRLDVATATITDDAVRGRPGRPNLIAWRQGAAVLSLTDDTDNSCRIVRLRDGQNPETLPLSAAGSGCASYPRDALEHWAIDGRELQPSPWQAQNWAYALVGLVVLAGAVLAARWRRRSHRA